MKKSLYFGVIIIVFILVFDTQPSYSQCSVNYVYPSYFNFSGNFDTDYATVSTYPEYCMPSISCSSWLSMYPQEGDTYIIICEQNSGTSRYGYINVGDAYISVYQEASLPLDPGSISITNTNICYGSSPGTIINSESASGGGCSTYSYSWSKSTNGTSFSSITGATGSTYNPGTMTNSQYFRRTAMCDGKYEETSPVYIEITQQLFPGSIADNQSIPYNTAPSTLTNYSSPSGGTGSYSYQWQISTDNSNWSNITGATYSSYSPGVLTSSKYYRRNVTSGPCVVNSSSILIDVNFANPSANQNYVYVQELNKEVDSISKFHSLYYTDIKHSLQYLDGRGRVIQTNIIEGSPNKNDIITPVYYDEYGRESVKYLPYTLHANFGSYIDTAISNQYHFYQNTDYYPGDTANSKITYENSPLNRILEQAAPGRPWQPYDVSDNESGHTVKFNYLSNSEHEVLIWKISGDTLINSGGDSYNLFNFYPENTLYKIITKDENWNQNSNQLNTVEEFQDKLGNTVLRRTFVESGVSVDTLDTYYVYDDFNLLRFVLTPKAIVNITGSMYQLLPSDNIIKDLCYYYKYDKRKRLIIKQIPGVAPTYMIYDKRDRLVLTQDGNLRKDLNENELKKWNFVKYDRLNRAVLTGILTFGSVQNQEQMQTVVDSLYSGDSPRAYYVDRNSLLTTTLGFTDDSFPKSTDGSMEYLTATYYDDYNFPDKKTFSTTNNISGYTDSQGIIYYLDNIKDVVVGSKAKILGTSYYITKTNYYDDKYRVIQSLSNLYTNNNEVETISNKYDFIGNLTQSNQKQYFDGSTTTINKYYTYDDLHRLLKVESKINSNSTVTVSEMSYNELGQLEKKELNNNLIDIDYKYNIRGWLTNINNPNSLGSDLFSLGLVYEDPSSLTNLTKDSQYNGNISAIIWNRRNGISIADTLKSAYTFIYDGLNRISDTYYGEGSSLTNSNNYREYDYSYDENGGLLALKRNNGSQTTIDNLTYSYLSNGLSNQLAYVTDNSLNASAFNDANTGFDDYLYDKNGNLIKDSNKGFTSISYNFLNLPDVLTKNATNKVTYTYDASGRKIKQAKTEGGTTTARYYFNGFEYDNSKDLNLIHMEEGVIKVSSSATVFKYEYFLKDHLGNTRIAFVDNSGRLSLTQSVDYYPFGLAFDDQYISGTDNKYLYNGKELQDESLGGVNLDLYDFHARMYDPQIGRTTTMDPLAEKFYGMSPYSMFANNPVLFVDPTGMEFTESAWKWVNRLIADINNRQASNNAKITEKKAQLDAGGLSSKEEKRLNRQIGRLGGQNTALEGVRGEIGTMAASEQVYNVIESSSQNESGPIPGTGTEIAYTSFNSNTGNIDFTIAPGAGLNMFAHELLHGYQFDQGLISLGAPGATGGRFLLDKTDEMAGYQRQGMFGTTEYTLPDRYKELPEGPVSIHNFSYQGVSMSDLVKNQNTFQLRALSRIMNQAYRVNMGGKWQTITK